MVVSSILVNAKVIRLYAKKQVRFMREIIRWQPRSTILFSICQPIYSTFWFLGLGTGIFYTDFLMKFLKDLVHLQWAAQSKYFAVSAALLQKRHLELRDVPNFSLFSCFLFSFPPFLLATVWSLSGVWTHTCLKETLALGWQNLRIRWHLFFCSISYEITDILKPTANIACKAFNPPSNCF